MSADLLVRAGAAGSSGRTRRWLGAVIAVVIIGLTVLVVYEPPSTGETYDPASRSPDGLSVVVDVLRELDVEVDVTGSLPDPATVDAVLAPPLGWDPATLVTLAEGGTRVVADIPPEQDAMAVELAIGGLGLVTRETDCALLADVGPLRSPVWSAWQAEAGALPEATRRCVTDGAAAWATEAPRGDGVLVSLGTFAPLVNDRMRDGDGDAAVAAVRLLAVEPGDRVAALTFPDDDAGAVTLFDLVDQRWFDAAWLTLLVLVLAAVARGRRLGRPVSEELPVRVPSGELARATGDLRHRIGAHDAAAEDLRQRTLAIVGERLGLGRAPDGSDAVTAARAAGIDLDDDAADALARPAGAVDAQGLTAIAGRLAAVRAAIRQGGSDRRPTSDAPGGVAGDGPPGTDETTDIDLTDTDRRPEQP